MSSLSDDDTDDDSGDSVFGSDDALAPDKAKKGMKGKPGHKEDHFPQHHTEVLTLSQDPSSVVGMEFDETNWDRHISSLKPMGLTILMNTCNPETVETYCTFMDHVYASVNAEDSKYFTHVSQRRCLCQLAKVMGFQENATETFQLKQKLALYKLPIMKYGEQAAHAHEVENMLSAQSYGDEDAGGGRRFARSRSFIKKRIPAHHTLSVLMQQESADSLQLLTQGSADLLLDLCSEFWDGSDIYPVNETDRKKILDFYQRATLSSYCTAFAYQPMAQSVDSRLGDYYIELPGNHKRAHHHEPPPVPGLARSSWDVDESRDQAIGEVDRTRKYHSLDSSINKLGNIRSAEECFKSQCGQIFIGMVTSNYQAKQDIVSLVEQMDNACIRFVHFSRDQELRSRVFSEKIGQEAGWNCHISLLEPTDHTSSVSSRSPQDSAPGGDVETVKIPGGDVRNDVNRSQKDAQVAIEVEAQRVRFGDPVVEAVVLLDMESDGSPKKTEDIPANHQILDSDQRESKENGNVSMRASSGTQSEAGRPCSRDADVEDTGDDDEDAKDESEAVRQPLLQPSSSSSTGRKTSSDDTGTLSSSGQQGYISSSSGARSDLAADETSPVSDPSSPSSLSSPDSTVKSSSTDSQGKSLSSVSKGKSLSPDTTETSPSEDSQDKLLSPAFSKPTAIANNKEEAKEGDALLSQSSSKSSAISERHRQISETQTFNSDVSAAETDTLSHQTESESAGGFDISNRAKLPRGIANIRPHLERIDNVPLLVPLFTDVTPRTTREMIEIMQEYGEVVCCLGSSLNITNAPIFAQADISISLEPHPPHICISSQEAVLPSNPNWTMSSALRSPMEVASLLTSLPCSLSFHRSDSISLISLIREARGLCNGMVNCFTFLIFGLLMLTALQLLCSLLFLPPPLSGRHVLWLSTVIVPLLSVALMGSNIQSKVMTQATGKNVPEHYTDHLMLFGFYFASKFMGSVVVSAVCHLFTLFAFCKKTAENPADCHFILHNRNRTSSWNGWNEELSPHLVLAQNIQTFILILYLVTSSASFVYCLKPLWRKPPFKNHLWCAIICAIFIVEIIYFAVDMRIWGSAHIAGTPVGLGDIPLEVWLLIFLWPLAVLCLCEAVKQYEIQFFVRWQKRTKLQFGTKLGMNSPF